MQAVIIFVAGAARHGRVSSTQKQSTSKGDRTRVHQFCASASAERTGSGHCRCTQKLRAWAPETIGVHFWGVPVWRSGPRPGPRPGLKPRPGLGCRTHVLKTLELPSGAQGHFRFSRKNCVCKIQTCWVEVNVSLLPAQRARQSHGQGLGKRHRLSLRQGSRHSFRHSFRYSFPQRFGQSLRQSLG